MNGQGGSFKFLSDIPRLGLGQSAKMLCNPASAVVRQSKATVKQSLLPPATCLQSQMSIVTPRYINYTPSHDLSGVRRCCRHHARCEREELVFTPHNIGFLDHGCSRSEGHGWRSRPFAGATGRGGVGCLINPVSLQGKTSSPETSIPQAPPNCGGGGGGGDWGVPWQP